MGIIASIAGPVFIACFILSIAIYVALLAWWGYAEVTNDGNMGTESKELRMSLGDLVWLFMVFVLFGGGLCGLLVALTWPVSVPLLLFYVTIKTIRLWKNFD